MALGFGFGLPHGTSFAGGNGAAAPGPSLNLDFTQGVLNNTAVTNNQITFSRASNATLVGSNGNIQYAPHNLLTYSEQFDNATWGKTGATVTANAIAGINGTTTADKLNEDTSTGAHYVSQGFTPLNATTYTYSVYVKAAGRNFAFVGFNGGSLATTLLSVNLSTGAISNAVGTPIDSSSTAIGNGWYRISITLASTGTTGSAVEVRASIDGVWANRSYTGDGTSGLYLWGAQLNVGSLQPYYPTTVKNLLGYTQEFDNAAWTKSNSSISATKVTAPDGSVTGQKLVEDSANSTHWVGVANSSIIAGTPYTVSCYLKKGERSFATLSHRSFTSWIGGQPYASFNLTSGTVVSSGTGATASITSVGNGWFRCSVAATADVSVSSAGFLVACSTDGTINQSYQGDGTSGIYIWGAQLSDSASLDTYVYNPVAAPSAAAYYGPRFDYDPVTKQPKGLLIEEQRSNLILNSGNGSAWTGNGTITVLPSEGLFTPALLATTQNWWRIGPSNVSLTSATSYACSVYVKSGTTNIFRAELYNASGSVTMSGTIGGASSTGTSGTAYTSASQPTTENLGNGLYRITTIVVPAISSSFSWQVGPASTTGQDIKIYGFQIEAGAFATSYIPTTSAQATRAADVAVMQGANFSNWWNQNEGTIYTENQSLSPLTASQSVALGKYPNLFGIDGSSTNTTPLWYGITAELSIGGAYNNVGSVPSGVNKFALATTSSANAASSLNGNAAVSRNGSNPVGAYRMGIGGPGNGTGVNALNGHIKRIAYYPRRLSNSELQGITA